MNSSSPFPTETDRTLLIEKISSLEMQLAGSRMPGGADVSGDIRELLGFVFEALPHFVAIVSTRGELLYLNQAACELTGLRDYAGKTLAGLLFTPAAYEDFVKSSVPAAQQRGSVMVETEFQRHDGRVFPVAQTVMAHRGPEGELRFLSILSRDITARRAAEAALREQVAILENAHDAVVVKDLEDRVIRWSAGATRFYGYQSEDALGRNACTLLGVDHRTYLAAMRDTLETGSWSGELTKRAKNGREVVIDSRWTLLRNAAGQPATIVCLDGDITERKRLEGQMLRAQRLDSIGSLAGGIPRSQ